MFLSCDFVSPLLVSSAHPTGASSSVAEMSANHTNELKYPIANLHYFLVWYLPRVSSERSASSLNRARQLRYRRLADFPSF